MKFIQTFRKHQDFFVFQIGLAVEHVNMIQNKAKSKQLSMKIDLILLYEFKWQYILSIRNRPFKYGYSAVVSPQEENGNDFVVLNKLWENNFEFEKREKTIDEKLNELTLKIDKITNIMPNSAIIQQATDFFIDEMKMNENENENEAE